MFKSHLALKGTLLLLGTIFFIFYLQEHPSYGSTSKGQLVYRRCITPRTVALTYDDNPNEDIYNLLALLKNYNATATFFPNAPYHFNAWKLDEYVHHAYVAGHQIGLHTWDHIHLDDVEPQEALDNLEKMNSWLHGVIGTRSRFVRPPFGECDFNCRKTLTGNGYTVVLWTLDTLDWMLGTNKQVGCSLEIIKGWTSNQADINKDNFTGPIVLMHSRYHTSTTVITQHFLDVFSSKGFRFVSVAECLGLTGE